MKLVSLLRIPLLRLVAAARTRPSQSGWAAVAGACAFQACVCLPFGLKTGFLAWEPVTLPSVVLPVAVTTVIAPALSEEAVFRAMLLAHPAVDGVLPGPLRLAAAAAMPLGVFVAYHLVNPQPQARQTFWDWRFLTMAGVLGAACTGAYHATGGSLAAAAVAHWLPVNAWLLLLGGYRKTRGALEPKP